MIEFEHLKKREKNLGKIAWFERVTFQLELSARLLLTIHSYELHTKPLNNDFVTSVMLRHGILMLFEPYFFYFCFILIFYYLMCF